MHYSAKAARPLPEDATVRYVIETRGSTFTVQAFSSGLLAAFGHSPRIAIRDFHGDAQFVPVGASLEEARLRISVVADSLEVLDDMKDDDRREIHRVMRDQVLETPRFPQIVYECLQVSATGNGDRYWISLNGELTLHGVTRALLIPARLAIHGESIIASGDFSLRQSDFAISPPTIAAGAIRIKDELKFSFNVVARKQRSDGQ